MSLVVLLTCAVRIISQIVRAVQLLTDLRIEEASHPEDLGSGLEYPGGKLGRPFQEFGKPETKGGTLPRDLAGKMG